MCGKHSLTKFSNSLIIVLRAKIVTAFGSKMVTISARDTIIRKFAKYGRLYFPYFKKNSLLKSFEKLTLRQMIVIIILFCYNDVSNAPCIIFKLRIRTIRYNYNETRITLK